MSAIKIIVITCLSACVACKNLQNVPSKNVDSILFSLKTTSCSGSCPVYEFYIYTSGVAKYVGNENTEMLGTYDANMNDELMEKLDSNLKEIDFFNITLKNNTLISDLPTKFIYYNDGSQQKKVKYYHPSVEPLDKLIKEIAVDINSMDWKRRDD